MANDQSQPIASPETLFGERVRQERESRGWTQAQLAARLADEGIHLHPSAIAKIEDRRASRPRMIRLDEARAFATAFGTTVDAMTRPPKNDAMQLFFAIRELLAPYAAHHERAQAVVSLVRDLAADKTGAVTVGERAIVQSYVAGVELAAAASSGAVKIIEHMDRLLVEAAPPTRPMGRSVADGQHPKAG